MTLAGLTVMLRRVPERCRRLSNAAASIDEWRKTGQSREISAKQLRQQSRTFESKRMVGPDRLRQLEGRDADSQRSGPAPFKCPGPPATGVKRKRKNVPVLDVAEPVNSRLTVAPTYYGNELERYEPRQVFRV
jgi:hypothetical protein